MAAERLRQFASAAAAAAVNITRPNYFDSSNRGETYELQNELNSDLQLVRKEAVKKVIAAMTTGKDVSALFPHVLKNIQTDDIELKKLVYLYLMNYAKTQPELVVLAINTFCKDAEDANPLVRALAIRTMGCLRVDKVLDYLCEPLRRALQDENAYVRKTAAVCAAKVVELSPELAEENGFVDMLKDMLGDNNPSVLANAVAALCDIHAHNPELGAFRVDHRNASRLVSVLNDCTEWGQITILDALSGYEPSSPEEAIQYIEKVTARLQHVNSSVVLSAIKVILVFIKYVPADHEIIDTLKKKLAPPLVSMLSAPPEVQYVVLRNIHLILQKYRDILAQGVRVFFCKFNDPLYVKLEKLEIITLLVDEDNYEQVLSELGEYSKEVDVEFAKKAITSIAACAVKVEAAADRAFSLLGQLITSKQDFMLQAAATALQLLLRRYPNEGLELVKPLLENIELYDEDEARAAVVWLIGQYGGALENAAELLSMFIDNFALEPSPVQSELLIACLKLFFPEPESFRSLLKTVIAKGLACYDNTDLRERCIVYSRILDVDATLARSLAANRLGLRSPGLSLLDESSLDALISQISTLASVYHRLPASEGHVRILTKAVAMPDLLNLDEEQQQQQQQQSGSSSFDAQESPKPVLDLLAD